MHILTVVGARPQFVKAAVVSRAIARHNADGSSPTIQESIVHTGQHYDHGMSRVFFEQMEIPEPVVDLATGSGSHAVMTGTMLERLEREIVRRQPDLVLVYGDTNSTLAAALTAAKLCVPLAHVEAGLRSFNRRMPEELNRIVADRLAQWLFCPSNGARDQLAIEGIRRGVHVVGDVMVDAVHFYRARAKAPEEPGAFALATIHRAENTDDPERLRSIVDALANAPIPIVLPLHPRTRAAFERMSLDSLGSLRCIAPLSYFDMLGYLERAQFVLTDSGGLQKEAFLFGKRCITLRDQTEWTELVELDANRLVGSDPRRIREAFAWAEPPLDDVPPVYGDGTAGDKIVRHLVGATLHSATA